MAVVVNVPLFYEIKFYFIFAELSVSFISPRVPVLSFSVWRPVIEGVHTRHGWHSCFGSSSLDYEEPGAPGSPSHQHWKLLTYTVTVLPSPSAM